MWTEEYFPSSDGSGVELHADVLRPTSVPAGTKTPVILAVGPYFSHTGQTGPEGFTQTGPSGRFADFTSGANLFARGYTYVMVDLRGFGGSTGCLDWTGPGEQADVEAAIDWTATQSWSNGKVGMYGKSYDAVTGLVGNNLELPALKAVVAQEPVWNMYNYLFSNGVPRPNVTGTPNAYNSIVTMPSLPDDTARYRANAAYETSHPECLSDNLTNNNNPDLGSSYWRERNLAKDAKGTDTPLFITQASSRTTPSPRTWSCTSTTTTASSAAGWGSGNTSAATTPTARGSCSRAGRDSSTRSCASTTTTSRASSDGRRPGLRRRGQHRCLA